MDNWKLGEDSNTGNYNKRGFTIGEESKDKGGGFDFDFSDDNNIKEDEKPKKEDRRNNNANRGNRGSIYKKVFYLLLILAAAISAYYIFKTIFSGNDLNIRLFGLKTNVFRSKVLPENNLVVTGYLLNKNDFPISYAKLSCKLYSTKNIILEVKHVYAGNFMPLKALKGMSNIKVDMKLNNKSGNNMSDVEILPNHPIKFMVVFFNISSNSKNYSISVSHFYRIKK